MDKKSKLFRWALAAFSILLISCATGKVHISRSSDANVPLDDGVYRLFLVGDAGEVNTHQSKNLELLRKRILASKIPSSVVYLGDNVYPRGVPHREDSSMYDWASEVLDSQITAVSDIAERTIFVPGNHDWNKGHAGGLKSIQREGKLIKQLPGNARLLPSKGCPGPEVVELTDNVVLIILDTQWWLQDWRSEKDINDGCEIRSRDDLIQAFAEVLKDYQEEQVIVAMHHPLMSAGSHGGYFTVKDHLFPLTNIKALKHFYLPLPILGSIYPIYRANIGNVEDIVNHKYQELKDGLLNAARFYKNVVFVSGHEHSLEYHDADGQHFLISGAGCKSTKIGTPRSLEYGHAAHGFMQLNLKANGAIDLLIWETDTPGQTQPAYSVPLTPGVTPQKEAESYPDISTMPDSLQEAISNRYAKGGLYRFLFGEKYRDIYEIPVTVKVLNMDVADGGLTPIKKGGGFQTNSLRLVDADGKEYAARSMNKDATRLLPENLKNTFASDILQDQFTASHPYAAFVLPGLAEKAGIYHTNPELVYIPRQEKLGRYNDAFGDQLYLLEERPSREWSDAPFFGRAKDIISFSDLIDKTIKDYRNQVDQNFVARSRLFDMFLGDWDRHDDQWRWAEFDRSDGKGNLYRPIPRDRDQAFSKYDGVLVGMAKWFTPGIRKLGEFEGDIKNLKWFNFNGRIFDRDFLNRVSRDEWITEAKQLQASISDEDIVRSVHQFPKAVYDDGGAHIIEVLKQRRDNLVEFAERYYAILAKTVMIRGTENADYIEITENPGTVRIRLYDSNKDGDKKEQYYDRTFLKSETQEIRVFALQGHDHIEVNGEGSGGIEVYVIGGDDRDRVEVTEGTAHHHIHIRDNQDRDKTLDTHAVGYKQVGDELNTYERSDFLYNYAIPKIIIGVNPDDGFLLGGGVQWVNYAFQKEPFGSRHSLDGFYAFSTGSYGFHYSGEWNDILGKIGGGLALSYQGPTFTQNFFGLGNDSRELAAEEIDYYRVRKKGYAITPSLRAGKDIGSSVVLRAGLESDEVQKTSGRFVSSPESGLPEHVFDANRFFTTSLGYRYRVVDNPVLTRHGVDFQLTGGLDVPLDGGNDMHRYMKASLAMYYQFKHLGKPVLATRIGTEFHGGDFQFYQGAILGAESNFRGVRKERWVGDKLFYHNTDLRIMLTRWHSYYLPAAMGLQFNFDHGRVWLHGEDSETWHYAYGGGIWISPFQTLLISLNYHKSDVDNRLSVGMGFLF